MDLTIEKENIKREIDLIADANILRAVKNLLSGSEPLNDRVHTLNEPLTDIEMALPGGRIPTKEQVEEWLDKDDSSEFLTGEQAITYMRQRYEALKAAAK